MLLLLCRGRLIIRSYSQKYKKLICEKDAEPKGELITGSFLEPNVIGQTGPSTIQNQQNKKNSANNKQTAKRRLIRKNLFHRMI